MILVTHAVGGAAAALIFKQHPLLAFVAGFASHFFLDAIRHWDYQLASFESTGEPKKKKLVVSLQKLSRDIPFVALDMIAGFSLTIIAVPYGNLSLTYTALLGALGGILPDALQVAYYLFPQSLLRHLQRFHMWAHANGRFGNDQLFIGIASQLGILVTLMGIVRILSLV